MEDKQRYVFLRTVEKDGVVSALIGDAQIIGSSGIRSLQLAFFAHAVPVSRAGVLPMTQEQLDIFAHNLEKEGMNKSLAGAKETPGIRRAMECVRDRTRAPLQKAAAAQAPH